MLCNNMVTCQAQSLLRLPSPPNARSQPFNSYSYPPFSVLYALKRGSLFRDAVWLPLFEIRRHTQGVEQRSRLELFGGQRRSNTPMSPHSPTYGASTSHIFATSVDPSLYDHSLVVAHLKLHCRESPVRLSRRQSYYIFSFGLGSVFRPFLPSSPFPPRQIQKPSRLGFCDCRS